MKRLQCRPGLMQCATLLFLRTESENCLSYLFWCREECKTGRTFDPRAICYGVQNIDTFSVGDFSNACIPQTIPDIRSGMIHTL